MTGACPPSDLRAASGCSYLNRRVGRAFEAGGVARDTFASREGISGNSPVAGVTEELAVAAVPEPFLLASPIPPVSKLVYQFVLELKDFVVAGEPSSIARSDLRTPVSVFVIPLCLGTLTLLPSLSTTRTNKFPL